MKNGLEIGKKGGGYLEDMRLKETSLERVACPLREIGKDKRSGMGLVNKFQLQPFPHRPPKRGIPYLPAGRKNNEKCAPKFTP